MNLAVRHILISLFALLSVSCTAPQKGPLVFRDGTTPSADGVAIHYLEGGEGATALVFVHGWTGDVNLWNTTMKRFAPRYRVVALDLAGHGLSGRERKDWSVDHFADDVSAVVRTLDLHHAILIGHSMSGAITVAAANQLGERVDALIPVDTLLDVDWDLPPAMWQQFFAGLRADFPKNVEEFVRTRLAAPQSPRDVINDVLKQARLADPKIAVPMLERGRDFDLKSGLRELRIPVYAINSDLNPTKIETNRKYSPRFNAEIMTGVGHWPHLEAPQRFGDALERVLANLAR